MTAEELHSALKAGRMSRSEVDALVQRLLDHPALVGELIDHISIEDGKGSFQAGWVLDHLLRHKPTYLLPHMEKFTLILASLKNESCIRPLAHSCEMVCTRYFKNLDPRFVQTLTDQPLERILSASFDWLISPMNTGPKVFAMGCLYHLGTKYPWVHPQLRGISGESMAQESIGYGVRAKKTLQMLARTGP